MLLFSWVSAGCGGMGWGWHEDDDPTFYSYYKHCWYDSTGEKAYRPQAVSHPPALPNLVGKSLAEKAHRIALEANPLLLQLPSVAATETDDQGGANWTPLSRFGVRWQTGLSDIFNFGMHFRHTLGMPLYSNRVNEAEDAPSEGTGIFSVGTALKATWRSLDGMVALSAIAELGLYGRRNIHRAFASWDQTCETTCYAHNKETSGSHTETYLAGSLEHVIEQTVFEAVVDASFALEGTVALGEHVQVVGLGSVQNRSIHYVREGFPDGAFDPKNNGILRWRSFPVFNLGAGVDLAAGPWFAQVFVFYPLEFEEAIEFGVAGAMATGVEF